MKVKRAALVGLLACLVGASASAQLAPNAQGDIGLFTMPSADSPLAGHWTFGLYGWKEQLTAGNLAFQDTEMRSRLYSHWAGEASLGIGLTDHWSLFASGGAERFENRGGWTGGSINSIQITGPFSEDESRKIRVGSKYNFISEADPSFRVALFASAYIPVNQSTPHRDQTTADLDHLNSRRTDWEWGFVATKGILSGIVSYQLSGAHDNDLRVANRLRFGAGVDWPVMPFLHIIGELDRTVMDGGDFPAENYSMLVAGARFYFGHSGWAISTALNANVDLLFKHGFSPSPVGGIVGITYAAWPPPPPPPIVVPAPAPPAPVVEQKTEVVQPAPPPPAPPVRAPKTTSDEIFFDNASARLTNIAKAILDGIALRMKNDLNSTAVITGYSDPSGSEQSNLAISAKRAAAAKEYLVTRHGIDPGRITTAAKGTAEPAYDNATPEGRAKNRRALIVVTFVSGS